MALLKIDLHRILRERLPKKVSRLVPGFLISGLERIIHQKELNEVLEYSYPAEGSAFCDKMFEYFGLTVETVGEENIPSKGRFIFASNHPLGGLDGVTLIKVLGERYGDDNLNFLVNDMLMNVEPLRPVFLPINKYGSQGRAAAKAIEEAYASDEQILIFPAGLVSRLHDDGKIADLKWQKSFIQKALEHDRDIIPVRFEGLNRPRFYRLARWRKKLGIKVNIEQAFLPAELCAARGKRYRVIFGRPIPVAEIRRRIEAGETPAALAAEFRLLSNP